MPQLVTNSKGAMAQGSAALNVQVFDRALADVLLLPFALQASPLLGKSSLLTILTGTESEAAAYEFTTLTCIPWRSSFTMATVPLLDLPGIH